MKKLLAVLLSAAMLFGCVFSVAANGADVDIDVGIMDSDENVTIQLNDAVFTGVNGGVAKGNDYAGVTASKLGTVPVGEQVTLSVDENMSDAVSFLGWYDQNDRLLSEKQQYSFTAQENLTVTPKFTTSNIIGEAAGFEGYANNQSLLVSSNAEAPGNGKIGFTKNSGYDGSGQGATAKILSGSDFNAVFPGAAANGNVLVSGTNYRSMVYGITVEKNTEYTLSYRWLAKSANKDANGNYYGITHTFLNTGYSIDNANSSTASKPGTISYSKTSGISNGTDWQWANLYFNSGDNEKLYLYFSPIPDGNTSDACTFAVDDLVCVKANKIESLDLQMKSCASLAPINFKMVDLAKINLGQTLEFKVIHTQPTQPTVTMNGTAVMPDAQGIYRAKVTNKNSVLSVRFAGDENLYDWDKDYQGRDLSAYNPDVYLESIWAGDTVYHESALFYTGRNTIKLLYPVDKMVSLRSYDLKTNFIENVDYKITADGEIELLPGSRIPVYGGALTSTGASFPVKGNEQVGLQSIGDALYTTYAVAATYTHKTTWDDGFQPAVPASQTQKLKNVMKKLEAGEDVNIVVYGDSISCGWSSSGLNNNFDIYNATETGLVTDYIINMPPYAPTWIEMFLAEMQRRYPEAKINLKNLSLGGMEAGWGKDHIAKRLKLWTDDSGEQIVPDLIMIGFGVNDAAGNASAATYRNNIEGIISNAKTATGNANLEFLLYSPMLPNQKAVTWDAETKILPYQAQLSAIAAADSKIGLVRLTDIFWQICKTKESVDYLNSNINHGNDFTARIYATGLLAAFEDNDLGGDINMDEKVDLKDVVTLTQYILGDEVEVDPRAVDVNGDKAVNLKDAAYLAQHIAGWENRHLAYIEGTFTATADTTVDAGYVKADKDSFTAVAYPGNDFLGWYHGEQLVSAKETVTQRELTANVTAKFKDNNLLSEIGGGYEKQTTGFKKVYHTGDSLPTTGAYYYVGASWASGRVVNTARYSGTNSFTMMSRYQNDAFIGVNGLEPNTQYAFSAKIRLDATVGGARFNGVFATPAVTENYDGAVKNSLGGTAQSFGGDTDWHEVTFTFNTRENTSIRIFHQYVGDIVNDVVAYLCLDELMLYKLKNQEDYAEYKMTALAENGIAYTSLAFTDYAHGKTDVTFTSAPTNRDAEFLGWFDADGTKVSEKRCFTVQSVQKAYQLTAKYTKGTAPVDVGTAAEITAALQKTGYYQPLFEKAIANQGNQALLAKAIQKAKRGEDITVVGLGGSITQGAGAYNGGTPYGQVVANYLQQQFPNIKVNYINAGIGATSSLLGRARMEAQVLAHNPDLVLLDFTTNDGQDERYHYSYEAVVRKLMEEQVATVAIMYGHVNNVLFGDKENPACVYDGNSKNLHMPSLLYYDVPVIDYFDTMWDYLDSNNDGVSDDKDMASWRILWADYIHPSNEGHKLAGNAINYYLQTVIDTVDSIDTTVPAVPAKQLYENTKYYDTVTMYDNSNIGSKLTASQSVKTGEYGNKDANTISYWEPWLIEQGGYLEITLDSLKGLTLMHIDGPAKILNVNGADFDIKENSAVTVTVNGQSVLSDSTRVSSGILNWASNSTYTCMEEGPVTLRITCTEGTFCMTSILIAE